MKIWVKNRCLHFLSLLTHELLISVQFFINRTDTNIPCIPNLKNIFFTLNNTIRLYYVFLHNPSKNVQKSTK